MTSSKTYPNITNGGDNKAWVYGCVIFDKVNNQSKLDNCTSYLSKSIQKVKCILDLNVNKTISIVGMPPQDFITGKNYSLQINNTNAFLYEWNFFNERFSSNNKSIIFSPKSDGCKAFIIKIKLFGGIQLANCLQYFVTSPFPLAPNKTQFYEFSNEEENINGANYGRLLSLNGSIWLTQDVTTGATKGDIIPSMCPLNFRYLNYK